MNIKTLGLAAVFWIVTIFTVQAGPTLIGDLGTRLWPNEPPRVWELDDSSNRRCSFVIDSEAAGGFFQTRPVGAPHSYWRADKPTNDSVRALHNGHKLIVATESGEWHRFPLTRIDVAFSILIRCGNAIMVNSHRVPMLSTRAAPAPQPSITEVPLLRNHYGTFTLLATLNGTTTLPFTLDTGASRVTLPRSVALELMRNGSLTASDYVGHAVSTLADGSRRGDILYRLRSVTIGGLKVPDVECSIGDERSSLLLGQSFLSKFRSWSIDNSRSVLVLTAAQAPR
jgi:clan AA aspartic protease (TIGR02281 family)